MKKLLTLGMLVVFFAFFASGCSYSKNKQLNDSKLFNDNSTHNSFEQPSNVEQNNGNEENNSLDQSENEVQNNDNNAGNQSEDNSEYSLFVVETNTYLNQEELVFSTLPPACTLMLLKNATFDTLSINSEVTFDLNGKNLEISTSCNVLMGGLLQICDSGSFGHFVAESIVLDGGDLYIYSGVFDCNIVNNGSVLKVYGGYFELDVFSDIITDNLQAGCSLSGPVEISGKYYYCVTSQN